LARHWIIRDAMGEQREVRGSGVVGMQPWIQPSDSFEYMSGCPLATEWGTMEGTYSMRTEAGEVFEAQIGRFFLTRNAAPLSLLDQPLEVPAP
jgi:ApaG protein